MNHRKFLQLPVVTTNYRESGSWMVASTSVDVSYVVEDVYNNTERFSQLIFRLNVHRKAGNYVYNTLVPMVVSSFLMTITSLIPTEVTI